MQRPTAAVSNPPSIITKLTATAQVDAKAVAKAEPSGAAVEVHTPSESELVRMGWRRLLHSRLQLQTLLEHDLSHLLSESQTTRRDKRLHGTGWTQQRAGRLCLYTNNFIFMLLTSESRLGRKLFVLQRFFSLLLGCSGSACRRSGQARFFYGAHPIHCGGHNGDVPARD